MARPDWIGQKLGNRYEIQELLGRGGMASVYKALDPNLNRVVAVKLIHPHLSEERDFVRRFQDEAAAVAQFRHPNIVQVYDFDSDDDTNYIIFEFVPGETLQSRLKRMVQSNRQFSIDEVIKITSGVASALDYAHRQGVVHRDIKPANVMLNIHGDAILMDFGIVKMVGGTQHTATGAVVGTARYMSPEQIKGQMLDGRSDIYSLGTMLYEMVSGRLPFDSESAMTLMMMHISDPVPDISNIRPDTPPGLVAVINKALAKDPNTRYQAAAELVTDLKKVAAGELPTAVSPPAAPAPDMTIVEPLVVPQTKPKTAVSPPSPAQTTVEPASSVPTPPPVVPPAPRPAPQPGGNRNMLYIGGGVVAVLLLLGILYATGAFGGGGGEGGEPTAVAVVEELPTEASEEVAAVAEEPTATEEAEPTATDEPTPTNTAEPTATNTIAPTATNTSAPEPTATSTSLPTNTPLPVPTNTPEPALPTNTPAPNVSITGISISGDRYIVNYTTVGYTEQLPGMHVHFFWNNISPENAGVGGSGPWFVWGGPRPFDGYAVSERPGNATQMCAIVANPDHTGQPATASCWNLP